MDKILTSSTSQQNTIDRDVFNNIVKMSAVGLHKNFKSKNKKVREETEEVIKYLAENLDGQSFTSLNKLVHDLRVDVLND